MNEDFKNLKDVHHVGQLEKRTIITTVVDLTVNIGALVDGKDNIRKG